MSFYPQLPIVKTTAPDTVKNRRRIAPEERERINKIRNRANALRKENPGLPLASAFIQAEKEVDSE